MINKQVVRQMEVMKKNKAQKKEREYGDGKDVRPSKNE